VPHIILDDHQAKVLTTSPRPVELRDRRGTSLGVVAPPVPAECSDKEQAAVEEDVRLALQRRGEDRPRLTTKQVLDRRASLEGR